MNLIPAIDLRGGRCVRLFQGDFSQETTFHHDPLVLADDYANLGLEYLHIVDLDGALSGTQRNKTIVEQIALKKHAVVQLGGGIRSAKQVEYWLDSGVDRIVIGTKAMTDVESVCDWLIKYGAERLVLALDVNLNSDNEAFVASHGWTKETTISLNECVKRYLDSGLVHILCTDIARDGALAGPNLRLYETLAHQFPTLRIQASGGIRNIDDLNQIRKIGIPSAICGRALLDGSISKSEVTSFLLAA